MQRRRHFYPGSPLAGSVPRRDKGIPGAWAILFVRAVVDDPAGCDHPSPALGAVAVAFRLFNTLGTRNADSFRGYLPTAHTLTYLRFAESVTVSGARLATDRAGSPLAERVSHPLDDKQGFMKSSHTPILLDQPCLVARRVAPGDYSPEALTRTGQGDFHHPAPPLVWLVAILPISALQRAHGEAGSVPASR